MGAITLLAIAVFAAPVLAFIADYLITPHLTKKG